MNTQLRQILVQSEMRFLTDGEVGAFRQWAIGVTERLECARRIEALETSLVATSTETFHARVVERGQLQAKTASDVRAAIRYIAMAHVRDDLPWFRSAYAEWVGEALRALATSATLTTLGEAIRAGVDQHLEPLDARALLPYLACLDEELRR